MKSLKSGLLTGIMVGITLMFAQCRDEHKSDQIPYNKEKAQEHIISINTAAQLTANFRKERIALTRQLKDSSYLNKSFNIPLAESFNRDAFAALLNQKGAEGIRVYLGYEKGLIKLVMVAVDVNNNDITGDNGKVMKLVSNEAAPIAIEAGQRCPTLCSAKGPINQ
jgi:hypothetical protein